jgi:AhpD family alkylhydroperoxidase
MATVKLIEYEAASPEVRAVYDDIMATRQIDWINNFWKAIAVQPELLRRTWQGVKEATAPGALDPLVKEMLYVAVSVTNGCKYCINSHTAAARKKGMTDEMLAEHAGRADGRGGHGQPDQRAGQRLPGGTGRGL